MADTQELITRLVLENNQFKKEIARSKKETDKLKSSVNKLKAGYLAVAGAIGGLIVGLNKARKTAQDSVEVFSKFNTVFAGVRKSANATAKDLVDNFGLSAVTARELLASTGDLLTGFGFTQEAALGLAGQVNRLGADLASFTNFSGGAAGASEALTKALLGERESVKSLGIAILASDVQNEVAKQGKDELTGSALRQARAEATLAIALRQSKNAQGDVARTLDSAANQSRVFEERLRDIGTVLGNTVIPFTNTAVTAFNKLTKVFSDSLNKDEIDEIDQELTELRENLAKAETPNIFGNVDKFAIGALKDQIKAFEDERAAIIAERRKNANEAQRAQEKAEELEARDKDLQDLTEFLDQTREVKAEKKIQEEQRLLEISKEFGEMGEQVREEIANRQLTRELNKNKAILDSASGLTGNLVQFGQNLIAQTDKDNEEQLKRRKRAARAFAIAQKATNSAQAVVAGILSVQQAAASAPVPYNAIPIAIAAAAAAANVAAIASTPIPKFQAGGIISGLSGAGPGNEDGIIAAQNGESVLNRQATAILGEDAINALNSGRPVQNSVNINVSGGNPNEVVDVLNDYFKSFGGARGVGIG